MTRYAVSLIADALLHHLLINFDILQHSCERLWAWLNGNQLRREHVLSADRQERLHTAK